MAVLEEVFVQPKEFLYQSPILFLATTPLIFRWMTTPNLFRDVIIPALEEEKMGRAAAFFPFCAPEISSAQSFAFAEGKLHQTASLCLPLARLLLMTSLPDSVLILTRKSVSSSSPLVVRLECSFHLFTLEFFRNPLLNHKRAAEVNKRKEDQGLWAPWRTA